jgi:hypothetical protein
MPMAFYILRKQYSGRFVEQLNLLTTLPFSRYSTYKYLPCSNACGKWFFAIRENFILYSQNLNSCRITSCASAFTRIYKQTKTKKKKNKNKNKNKNKTKQTKQKKTKKTKQNKTQKKIHKKNKLHFFYAFRIETVL